ncbi:MAG: replication associated protein [Wigfec virus K19_227]|nr:MAG: replication associated protein [Wigfec virus K19_227]
MAPEHWSHKGKWFIYKTMDEPRGNSCAIWDFTIWADRIEKEDVLVILQTHCKHWAFQLEKSETNEKKLHYQGRVSLIKKRRKQELFSAGIFPTHVHISPTSNNAKKGEPFYVLKAETRVEGPWTDADKKPSYIPRQIRDITLRPFQESVIASRTTFESREVNLIYDPEGASGKSTLRNYIAAHDLGRFIPFANDYKDIMRMIWTFEHQSHQQLYVLDLPRALKKEKLFQMWGAIESIKDGYAFDERYKFKEIFFDSPVVWVFTNQEPDQDLLSRGRWRIWMINRKDWTLIDVTKCETCPIEVADQFKLPQ